MRHLSPIRRRAICLVALVTAGLSFSSTPSAAVAGPKYGYWLDAYGNEWCGGPCVKDNWCCYITPVEPMNASTTPVELAL